MNGRHLDVPPVSVAAMVGGHVQFAHQSVIGQVGAIGRHTRPRVLQSQRELVVPQGNDQSDALLT